MFPRSLCLVVGILYSASAEPDCPSLTLRHGNFTCVSSYKSKVPNQSLCQFTCDDQYELRNKYKLSFVYCNNGEWYANRTTTIFSPSSIECRYAGFRRSLTLANPNTKCSNKTCVGAGEGIPLRDCLSKGCCWNPSENSCRAVVPTICPGSLPGIPEILCTNPRCSYDQATSMCMLTRHVSIDNSIQARSHTGNPCLEIGIPNSNIQCAGKVAGSYPCNVYCDVGFVAEGNTAFNCDPNNLYNFKPDWQCKEILCPHIKRWLGRIRPHLPQNTRVDCSDGRRVNSTCSIVCPPHHKNVRVSKISCKNGLWSGGLPKCQEKSKCRSLQNSWPSANWAVISTNCTKDEYVGVVCSFLCPSGYKLVGKSETFCMIKEKRWNVRPPRCHKISTLDTKCDYQDDFEKTSKKKTSEYIQISDIRNKKRRHQMNKCNVEQKITINATRMQSVTLTMKIKNPTFAFLMVKIPNNVNHQTIPRSDLFYFGLLGNYNVRSYQYLTYRSHMSLIFSRNNSSISVSYNGTMETIPMETISLASFDNLLIQLWVNRWNVYLGGSGICNICVSYTL